VPRSLKRIDSPKFQGFGCSGCSWKFEPSGVRFDDSIDEMKRTYEAERDKQFAVHVCAEHPKDSNTA
jgi:hypothetical protein